MTRGLDIEVTSVQDEKLSKGQRIRWLSLMGQRSLNLDCSSFIDRLLPDRIGVVIDADQFLAQFSCGVAYANTSKQGHNQKLNQLVIADMPGTG
jgi:hypothetical protein